MAKTKPLLTEK